MVEGAVLKEKLDAEGAAVPKLNDVAGAVFSWVVVVPSKRKGMDIDQIANSG